MEQIDSKIANIIADIADCVACAHNTCQYINPISEMEERLDAMRPNPTKTKEIWWPAIFFLAEYADSSFHEFPSVGKMSWDEASALLEKLRKYLRRKYPAIPSEIIERFNNLS